MGSPRMYTLREASPSDAHECLRLRGLTRENAVSVERLASIGITAQSWARDIDSGKLVGWVASHGTKMAGYCFDDRTTGEVVVLALLPQYEAKGMGRRLLSHVTENLREAGYGTLFLGCAADPTVRSYGFYRHLGWRSTGQTDQNGDEILELRSG
ncbi:MAG: GNAT family N-acetyltransferase [Xanthomonadales bacterium]|nr:GNAT family N-acetyltransferase [Xanthomonadales bacterium]